MTALVQATLTVLTLLLITEVIKRLAGPTTGITFTLITKLLTAIVRPNCKETAMDKH
jgi:hypothetical protein